jgi:hypothetical protein
MNKKALIITIFIALLFIVPLANASSSAFLQKASQWYQNNCTGNVSKSNSISCYSFDKIQEVDQALVTLGNKVDGIEQDVADFDTRVDSAEGRLTALEATLSAAPTSTPSSQAIKVFDNNNTELGIFGGDVFTIFYPPLNRFYKIEGGKLGYFGSSIFYSELNCLGNAYAFVGDNDLSEFGNRILSAEIGRYYIIPQGTPTVATSTKSNMSAGSCANNNGNPEVRALQQITPSLPDPIALPIHFQYQ